MPGEASERQLISRRLHCGFKLGRKRQFALLDRFGSIEAIKKAYVEDIAGLKGFTKKLAEEVLQTLADS